MGLSATVIFSTVDRLYSFSIYKGFFEGQQRCYGSRANFTEVRTNESPLELVPIIDLGSFKNYNKKQTGIWSLIKVATIYLFFLLNEMNFG